MALAKVRLSARVAVMDTVRLVGLEVAVVIVWLAGLHTEMNVLEDTVNRAGL